MKTIMCQKWVYIYRTEQRPFTQKKANMKILHHYSCTNDQQSILLHSRQKFRWELQLRNQVGLEGK